MESPEFFITLPSDDTSFSNNTNVNYQIQVANPIELRVPYQLCLYEAFYTLGKTNKPDLFINCNLVRPQTVGSQEVQLLKHLIAHSPGNAEMYQGLSPLQYVDLNSNSFNRVEIEITNQLGELQTFAPGSITTIVLGFRQKPDY